jgi:hypothetical protein
MQSAFYVSIAYPFWGKRDSPEDMTVGGEGVKERQSGDDAVRMPCSFFSFLAVPGRHEERDQPLIAEPGIGTSPIAKSWVW